MKPVDLGPNRTGIKASPIDAPDVIQYAQRSVAHVGVDGAAFHGVRIAYARESDEPTGLMPPPSSVKGAAKAVLKLIEGQSANVLLDKLGERAGFERTGVRLYDLALAKHDVYGSWEDGPTRADLVAIRGDEPHHYGTLVKAIDKLGADPTALTPSANLASVLSMGVPQALADPRTDLLECLHGLLVAELVDNASWALLITLADELGQDALAQQFNACLLTEDQHLERVRHWIEAGVIANAENRRPSSDTERRPSP